MRARKQAVSTELLNAAERGKTGRVKSTLCNVSLRDIGLVLVGAFLALAVRWLVVNEKFTSCTQGSSSGKVVPKEPGWGPIHVYYGAMDHLTRGIPSKWWLKTSPNHQEGEEWFSQHGQDVAVAKVLDFRQNGFFVDLAANDAVWASNTFSLEQNFNWRGICIEPNPIYWYRLSFRKCHVVGSFIGGTDLQEVNVTLSDKRVHAPYGGIIGKDFDRKNAVDPQPRYTASLTTILQKFDAPTMIDYISLDVEGAEEFIMKEFPFDKYQFLVMTIERPSESLQGLLDKHGYKKAIDIKMGDTLWVHHSIYEKAKANLEKDPEEIAKHVVKNFPAGVRSNR